MARLARIVLPQVAHHVTQRGNRRQPVFFADEDYVTYLELVDRFAQKADTRVLAYCLMPNHVHFVLQPSHADGLRAALGEAHRRYTRHINQRAGWRGHLWQERFHSYPMDDAHLRAAVRYIERNPVAAGLTERAGEWPWSSARAHLEGRPDPHISLAPRPDLADRWADYLNTTPQDHEPDTIERHLRTGRPLADEAFIARAERTLGRVLHKRKPGPARTPPDATP